MKPTRKVSAVIAAGSAVLLTASACGSGGGDDPASQNLDARGPITYVQGKDNSNIIRPIIAKWNKAHPDEKVTFKEQTDEADQQHDDLREHFLAEDAGYDVMSVDVVWTAEFAAQGWLQPLEGDFAVDTTGMLQPTVESGTYNGKLYTAPQHSDGGLLYYRKDLVPNPPKTWDEMMGMCDIADENNMGCYAGQFSEYEGLTVNAAEAINTAGGDIVEDDGITPAVDTPESREGLQNLVEGFESGNIPAKAITYTEEEGRIAFQAGDLLFLRNWPYVYALAQTEGGSKVKGKFGVAPLPGSGSTVPGVSSLGGHNAGISVFSDNKATARDFVQFMVSEQSQKFFLEKGSLAPTRQSLYDDPALVKQFPYLPTLETSIQNAEPRPVTPFYPAVTEAVQANAYAALKGSASVDQAIAEMSKAISAANTQ
ncbi:MAG: ABC transporter substrate-binding protein [Actinomycetota bacterium]|nr:ABC transporter substrate-binding protein [Actinomycetota bacterium]